MVRGAKRKGDTPPRMIAVVVLYAAILELTWKCLLRRRRLGLIKAEVYGPKKAMNPT